MTTYDEITEFPKAEYVRTKVVNDRPSGVQYEIEVWRRDGKEYWFRRPNDGSKGLWERVT